MPRTTGNDYSDDDDDGGADAELAADMESEDFNHTELDDNTFDEPELRQYARLLFENSRRLKAPKRIFEQNNNWTYTNPYLLHSIVKRRSSQEARETRVDMRTLIADDAEGTDAWNEMIETYEEYMECVDQEDKITIDAAKSIHEKLRLPLSTGMELSITFCKSATEATCPERFSVNRQ